MPEKEIGSIRKTAEQEFIRALAKFHQRRIEHLQRKRTKVEQELSREKNETNAFQTRKRRTLSAPRDENIHMSTDVLKIASNIQAKVVQWKTSSADCGKCGVWKICRKFQFSISI